MANTNPIIIVRGIQGSWLKDEYPADVQIDILWTGVMRRKFAALHLHDLDATVDESATRLVNPHEVVPLIYESLVGEIREEVEDNHTHTCTHSLMIGARTIAFPPHGSANWSSECCTSPACRSGIASPGGGGQRKSPWSVTILAGWRSSGTRPNY